MSVRSSSFVFPFKGHYKSFYFFTALSQYFMFPCTVTRPDLWFRFPSTGRVLLKQPEVSMAMGWGHSAWWQKRAPVGLASICRLGFPWRRLWWRSGIWSRHRVGNGHVPNDGFTAVSTSQVSASSSSYDISTDARERDFLFQRLSVTIQRFSAPCFTICFVSGWDSGHN